MNIKSFIIVVSCIEINEETIRLFISSGSKSNKSNYFIVFLKENHLNTILFDLIEKIMV